MKACLKFYVLGPPFGIIHGSERPDEGCDNNKFCRRRAHKAMLVDACLALVFQGSLQRIGILSDGIECRFQRAVAARHAIGGVAGDDPVGNDAAGVVRLSVHAAHAHAGHGEGEQGQRELRHVARGPGRRLSDDLAQVVVAHYQQDGFTPADDSGIAQEGCGQGHMWRFGPEGF